MEAIELVNMIRDRYSGNAYVVLEQVPDGTGWNQVRWIDAAVFSLWPSHGLTRSAFEVKVDRSDFIRELQTPLKHQWARECFHEFWFVAPKEVIKDDELPEGAGHMYPRGGKLVIRKHCVRNGTPKLDDSLLAAFMRAAGKDVAGARKQSEEDILSRAKPHQIATAFQQAVVSFCNGKSDATMFLGTEYTVEAIVEWLERATMDKQLQKDLYQLAHVTESFQRQITDLFSLFAVIANRSILARDLFGKYLVSTWGAQYGDALQVLRDGKKKSKLPDQSREILAIIRKWDSKKDGE